VVSISGDELALDYLELEVFSLNGARAQVLRRSILWNNVMLPLTGDTAETRVTITQRFAIPPRARQKLTFTVYVEPTLGTVIVIATAKPAGISSAAYIRSQDLLTATLEIEQLGPAQSGQRSAIVGQIRDLNSVPQPNIVVRAFRMMTQAAAVNPYTVNGELGEKSVMTDANGEYSFTGLEPGTYRISPQFTDQEFFPPNLAILAGELAPEIAALRNQQRKSPRCQVLAKSDLLVNVDRAARALQDLGITFAQFYVVRLSEQQQAKVRTRFERAIGRLQRSFTLLLNLGAGLPTVQYQCEPTVRCTVESRLPLIKRYSSLISQMRRITLSIIYLAKKQQLSSGDTDQKRLAAVVRRNHRSAVKAWRQLPRQARSCTEDTG
jgi:hypothetical protein